MLFSPWIVCFSFPSFVGLFLINFQILFFLFMEFNCRVRVCDIVKLFFKYMINQPLFFMIQQLSLFYSHVHIQCFSEQVFFFLTSLIELCFQKWNCYHVLLFIKDLCLQEWLKSWLHVSLCFQSRKGFIKGNS